MPIDKSEVTVVVPTFNEEKAIGLVLDELFEVDCKNVLVVDGYSEDATVKLAESRGVRVVQQNGRGKTGALKTAVDYVKTPYMLVMDGDYTYCAKDIERFLNNGDRYVHVVGVRERVAMGWVHRFGNWVITRMFNLLMSAGLSDVCSGMYLLKTDVAQELELQSSGFRTEVEVIAQTAMEGGVTEVPICYRPRIGRRKLSTWRHGFEILASIVSLARRYNPVLLFAAIFALSIIPACVILGWVGFRLLTSGIFHSGWALLGVMLLLLASQSLAVSTVAILLKRMERRIRQSLGKD